MVSIMVRFLQFLTKEMLEAKEEIMLAGVCSTFMINCSEKGNKRCRTKIEEEATTPL